MCQGLAFYMEIEGEGIEDGKDNVIREKQAKVATDRKWGLFTRQDPLDFPCREETGFGSNHSLIDWVVLPTSSLAELPIRLQVLDPTNTVEWWSCGRGWTP